MRKELVALASALAFAVALIPAPRAYAVGHVRYYTVREACIYSGYGMIIGEWTTECDGSTNGWGVQPGAECSTTSLSFGESCGPPNP